MNAQEEALFRALIQKINRLERIVGVSETLESGGDVTLTGDQTVAGVKTFSDQAIFDGSTINSSVRAGAFEIQSYAVNNDWLADNAYYDGGGFRYRANGLAVVQYFLAGSWSVYTVPTGTAGNAATLALRFTVRADGNIGIGTVDQFGSGTGVIGLANASVAPTTNPTGGGVIYCESGKLMYRGSSGTITQLAAA